MVEKRVWEREGGQGKCPALDTLGMPTLDTGNGAAFAPSFRLALQQLQQHVRRLQGGQA